MITHKVGDRVKFIPEAHRKLKWFPAGTVVDDEVRTVTRVRPNGDVILSDESEWYGGWLEKVTEVPSAPEERKPWHSGSFDADEPLTKPGRTKRLKAALKVIEEWQRYRDYLTSGTAAVTGMTEQAYLFYATLDIHAEILNEALRGHTDPELALKLATLITHPKEEFEKGA